MSETAEVIIEKVLPAEENRPYKVIDRNEGEYATFKDELGKQAQGLVGKKARVHFTVKEVNKDGRTFKNVYLDGLEEIADTNGDTPPLGTGEYVKGQTAPADKASINRAVALKAAVALCTHTIPTTATPSEMVNNKVGALCHAFEHYLSTGTWPSDEVPF